MRAAKIKNHPAFAFMTQADIQSVYYMQMPRWLFFDPRYAELSLDAKVTYTFLLNRFQLSRRNGWVNDQGEVFVIFPRKALAAELRICEQRVTAAFRALKGLDLIWEKRCGRGDANQIYLAVVKPQDDPDYACAPFLSEEDCGSRTADLEGLAPEDPPASGQDPQVSPLQDRENGSSRSADFTAPEPRDSMPKKKEDRKKDPSYPEVSQSFKTNWDRPADDEEELLEILDACELDCFAPEAARVFENAVERLFYSDSFRVGNATLPRSRVRARLRLLDGMVLRSAEEKLRGNLDREVKNSTAYVMATIFNAITESESDLLVDPDLNRLGAPPGRR